MYTMKIQLLTNGSQNDRLMDVMKKFNEVCNHISEIGFQTKTYRNKIRLQKECYHLVREKYNLPSQMVVRAIGKVVEAYKTGIKSTIRFGENTSVVYDTRLLAFKWMQAVSIATFEGRIEVPIRVSGYRRGSYDRRVTGQADLILEGSTFYLLVLVNLPEGANISTFDFTEVI